jgi:hypothetical protein
VTESRLNVEAVRAVLLRTNGNFAAAGRRFGVNRSTVLRFVRKHAELQATVADCRETRLDVAESLLDRAVLAGQPWAIAMVLRTLGRSRGYVTNVSVDVREIDSMIESELEKLADARAAQAARQRNGTGETNHVNGNV